MRTSIAQDKLVTLCLSTVVARGLRGVPLIHPLDLEHRPYGAKDPVKSRGRNQFTSSLSPARILPGNWIIESGEFAYNGRRYAVAANP